jgi:GT2 family glycosyltransferase
VISVLVVNYRRRDLLNECLASVEASLARVPGGSRAGELIVIDNGSDDGSADMVRERHPTARLIELPNNEGFAPAVVRGTTVARGDWLLLVNNDATVAPDAIGLLLAAGELDDRVGAVTAQVRFADRPDTINSTGLEIDKLGICYDRHAGSPVSSEEGGQPVQVFGASGCVAAYRREMLDEIGGFDPSFFAFLEDADLAWRARMAGWRCVYEPRAVAHHHGSATAGEGSTFKYELVGRNRVRLLAKNATRGQLARWGWAMLAYDVAYVVFVALMDRTLAPLRGRLRGLREWRAYRRAGAAGRREIALHGTGGWRRALAMRNAYRGST